MLQIYLRSAIVVVALLFGSGFAYAGFPVKFGSDPEWTVDFDCDSTTITNDTGQE